MSGVVFGALFVFGLMLTLGACVWHNVKTDERLAKIEAQLLLTHQADVTIGPEGTAHIWKDANGDMTMTVSTKSAQP